MILYSVDAVSKNIGIHLHLLRCLYAMFIFVCVQIKHIIQYKKYSIDIKIETNSQVK